MTTQNDETETVIMDLDTFMGNMHSSIDKISDAYKALYADGNISTSTPEGMAALLTFEMMDVNVRLNLMILEQLMHINQREETRDAENSEVQP